jgi:hypothetical protein
MTNQEKIKKFYRDHNIQWMLNSEDLEGLDECIRDLCLELIQTRWALENIMDGMKQHEIQEITGLPETDCQKIWDIYSTKLR